MTDPKHITIEQRLNYLKACDEVIKYFLELGRDTLAESENHSNFNQYGSYLETLQNAINKRNYYKKLKGKIVDDIINDPDFFEYSSRLISQENVQLDNSQLTQSQYDSFCEELKKL